MSLHEPSSTSNLNPITPTTFTNNGNNEILTIQSEAKRLTKLKDDITNRLDIYFEVLKSVS